MRCSLLRKLLWRFFYVCLIIACPLFFTSAWKNDSGISKFSVDPDKDIVGEIGGVEEGADDQAFSSSQINSPVLVDGKTELMQAVQAGRSVEALTQLIARGEQVNARSPWGDSALLMAIDKVNYDHIALLLREGADPNHWSNGNAMARAKDRLIGDWHDEVDDATNDLVNNIIDLLVLNGANDSSRDLVYAISKNTSNEDEILPDLEMALHNGADANAWLDGGHILTFAIEKKLYRCVTLLLDNGASANAKNRRGTSALTLAIQQHVYPVVLPLVARGAQTRELNANKDTAFSLLIEVGYSNYLDDEPTILARRTTALALLDQGIFPPWNETPLPEFVSREYHLLRQLRRVFTVDREIGLALIQSGYVDIYPATALSLVIESDAPIDIVYKYIDKASNFIKNDQWRRPLGDDINDTMNIILNRSSEKNFQIATYLFDKGAAPNSFTSSGLPLTFLNEALSIGNTAMAQLLLERGADPELSSVTLVNSITDSEEFTDIDYYFHNQMDSILNDLESHAEKQALVDSHDVRRSPLHWAVAKNNVVMVRKLLEMGVNASVKDSLGETPMNIATRNQSTEIIEMLQEHLVK